MKIKKGQPITELVKGSMEYTKSLIYQAFRAQFPSGDMGPYCDIADTFADYVIISEYGSATSLKSDEYYKVTYSKNGEAYVFAPRDQWEVVELTYQPQTMMSESKKKKGKRIEETISPNQVQLLEAKGDNTKMRRLRINDLMVADEVNGNNRLYPPDVIGAMVQDWRPYLRESRGQGRLVISEEIFSQLTGEVEHPSDKGKQHPEYLETVVRWDTLDWDGKHLNIEGDLILTSKGRDVEILMDAGVKPGGSIRGMGESKIKKVGDKKIEEVVWVSMNAADLVGDPSFKNAAALQESINQGDDEMNIEELIKLLKEHPELFQGVTEAQVKAMGEAQLKALEEKIREALGIDLKANIVESLLAIKNKAFKFEEAEKQTEVTKAIEEACKDLPFGKKLNEMFAESLKSASLADATAVKQFAESKRKEYSQLAAAGVLKGMGFDEKKGRVQMIGDVLENETGTPEFARPAFEITESIRKSEMRPAKNLHKNESRAAIWTLQLLERYDKLYQRFLLKESQEFQEAETATDLSLPYSVSRAVIAEAFPNLVAANVFDVGLMDQSPMNIFYETFAGDSGYTTAVTDEVETAGAEGTWYALDHANIVPGTVVVTSNPAGTTYVEGTDYVIDYELGKIKLIAAGSVDANDVLVDYSYNAIREGEGAEIQQAEVTLAYQTITAAADRVADQINHEAIVFSRSQLGWDAVGRTMANIVRQVRLNIDRRLIEKALAAALSVASNSGGTWDSAVDPYSELVEKLGVAKVKVANRYYEPTSFLMSVTNADLLSNWDGFMRTGFPNALLDAAGFVGSVKGLPVFASTQMRDAWSLALNRQIVLHRVYQPMLIKGPFPTYGTNRKLIAADQYYSEEYNGSLVPITNKASYVKID